MENRSTISSPRLRDHSVNSTIRLDFLVDEIQDIHVIIIYLWIIPLISSAFILTIIHFRVFSTRPSAILYAPYSLPFSHDVHRVRRAIHVPIPLPLRD